MNAKAGHSERAPNLAMYWGVLAAYLLVPLIFLVAGGDLNWWQAWTYSVLVILAGVAGRWWSDKRNPGLASERFHALKAPDVKPWDRWLAPLAAFSVGFPLHIVAALDHRFGWSLPFLSGLDITGLVLVALGYGFSVWALVENRFFSLAVRIQADRGHRLVDSGPYRIVRHPGYAGNIPAMIGMVLALGSLWMLIPVAVALFFTGLRTALEDRTLQAELPGYREYAQRVRYRLIPGIY